ncbi:DUF192 domain-containing protein [Thermoleophilum album]|uniref:DUF192 domain-containing protein n=1 Tax=Thermoleophilum album TaxID=29539 RepID=UPI00237D20BF|nr:DUF192 domain-containing protein [Thermoleophilum album]WDT93483.1 DUF192 domain-containing protein [Thermoleophilum album]
MAETPSKSQRKRPGAERDRAFPTAQGRPPSARPSGASELPCWLRGAPTVKVEGFTLALALTPLRRALGLTGVALLPDGWGLVLAPCASVHTLTLRCAIDVVFADQAGAVLQIYADVPPRRLRAARGAAFCVECRAGEARRLVASGGCREIARALKRERFERDVLSRVQR